MEATDAPELTVEEKEERLLFFFSGGERFSIDIAGVREIVVGETVTPVPMAPLPVLGVINHRGKIYTILSFARLMGFDPDSESKTAIFLDREGMAAGIAVAGIEGIKNVPLSILEGARRVNRDQPGVDLLTGVIDFGGRTASLVDGEDLVETILQISEHEESPAEVAPERRESNGQ